MTLRAADSDREPAVTLRQVLAAALEDVQPSTVESYKTVLKPLYDFFGAERDIATITVKELEDYQTALMQRPASVGSSAGARVKHGRSRIRLHLAVLGKAFNLAIRHGKAKFNPVSQMKKVRPAEPRSVFLGREQLPELLAALNETDQLTVLLILYTGMRGREAFLLRKSDIDYAAGEIRLLKTKSKKPRAVPIHADLVPILETACDHPGEWVVQDTRPCWAARMVKPSSEKARLRLQKTFQSRFRQALSRCNVTQKLTPHDLRRTCATWLLDAGADLSSIRDLLGHSTVAITEIYARTTHRKVRQAVNSLPSLQSSVCSLGRGNDQAPVATSDANEEKRLLHGLAEGQIALQEAVLQLVKGATSTAPTVSIPAAPASELPPTLTAAQDTDAPHGISSTVIREMLAVQAQFNRLIEILVQASKPPTATKLTQAVLRSSEAAGIQDRPVLILEVPTPPRTSRQHALRYKEFGLSIALKPTSKELDALPDWLLRRKERITLVREVDERAFKTGFRSGDVLLEVNERTAYPSSHLPQVPSTIGTTVKFAFWRPPNEHLRWCLRKGVARN